MDYDRSNIDEDGFFRPEPRTNSFAVASLVMGILSLVCCCCGYLGIAAGGLGIMFALLSRGREPMCGQARAGIILSAAGMFLGLISILGALVLLVLNETAGGM